MPAYARDTLGRVVAAIECWGLIPFQHPVLPSVVGLVAGGPVRGSWWSHPRGGAIFHLGGDLLDRDDVLYVRLLDGRVTLVHARLVPSVIAIGRARDPWQLVGLSAEAVALLGRLDREGPFRATGPAARDLERSLLVTSRQVHTETGAHAKHLIPWESVARERGLSLRRRSAARGRAVIEEATARLNRECAGSARLPWQQERRR